MHCIIAGLPGVEEPVEIDAPRTSSRNRPIIAHRQNDECCERQMSCSLPETNERNITKRPVLIKVSQPEVADSRPPSPPIFEKKPKKTRAKRASESDIRQAVKLVYDEDMAQKEAERACNLPRGTLSRRRGKQIMAQYRKDWGTPTIINSQRGVSKKELEKAFLYGDDR